MQIMDLAMAAIIPSEQVEPRTYFLMELMEANIIISIRIGLVMTGVIALAVYWKMKKR